MATDHLFHLARLRCQGRSFVDAAGQFKAASSPLIESGGGVLWGCFHGLFGLASNELVYIHAFPAVPNVNADVNKVMTPALAATPAFTVADQLLLRATVRPFDATPRQRTEGIYVLRWFQVDNKDADAIGELSQQAWGSWESDFASEVQGLFAQIEKTGKGRMLLLSWYEDLATWEASRSWSAAEKDIFRRRHEMTEGTSAWATRLLPR